MTRGLPRLRPALLAGASLFLLLGLASPAAAQIYSCPPGYYLASDYQCYPQGYAVAPPAPPYVYYPPYPYAYRQPYYYPGFGLQFNFGGGRGFGHDRDDHFHGDGHRH